MGILSTIGNALFGGGNNTKKKKTDYTTSSGTQYNATYHDPNQGNINMSSKDINYTTKPTTSASTTASKNNYTNAMNKVTSATYNPSSAVTAAKNGYDAAKKTVEGMEFNFSEKGKKEYEDALNYYKSLGFSESEATRQAYNAYIDGVNAKPGEYSESERVQASRGYYEDVLKNKPGEYSEGQRVQDARAYLDSILNSKPGDFTFDDTALNDVYNKIMNREDFSFDLNSSALYQQYKDQYQALGQQAMMDTMGQASAMTGGYGSSYATSAGQQAYQNQLQNLNNIIPELYGMAMQQYQIEGQQMLDQYGIASDQRNFAYGQYRDSVNDWMANRDYATNNFWNEQNFDYGKYRDSVADWQNDRAFAYNQYADERNFDWGQYMDKYSNWLNTQNLNLNAYSTFWGQDFNKYESELNRAGNLASMAQSDYFNYWDQEFSKYNSDLSKNIDLAKMAQGDYQYASDFDYRTFRDSVEDNKWAAGMYNSDWWNGVQNDTNIWSENNANAFKAANFDFSVAQHNADSRYKYNSLNDSNAQAAAASALDNARFGWEKDTWAQEFQYKQGRDKVEDEKWSADDAYRWATFKDDQDRWRETFDYGKDRDKVEDEKWSADDAYRWATFKDDQDRWAQEFGLKKGNSGGTTGSGTVPTALSPKGDGSYALNRGNLSKGGQEAYDLLRQDKYMDPGTRQPTDAWLKIVDEKVKKGAMTEDDEKALLYYFGIIDKF